MDILKQQIWNEMRATLERFELLNDMLQRNEMVDAAEYRALLLKIRDLEYRLDHPSQEVA